MTLEQRLLEIKPLLNWDGIIDTLLGNEGSRLTQWIRSIIGEAAQQGIKTDAALDAVVLRLNALTMQKFAELGAELPIPSLEAVIYTNTQQASQRLEAVIEDLIHTYLVSDSTRAISFATNLLAQITDLLTPRDAPASLAKRIQDLEQQRDHALADIRSIRRDIRLKLVFQSGKTLRKALDVFERSASELYIQHTRKVAAVAAETVFTSTRVYVDAVRKRMQVLQANVEKIIYQMDDLCHRMDKRPMSEDGATTRVADLADRQIVEQEYSRCLAEAAAARNLHDTNESTQDYLDSNAVGEYFRLAAQDVLLPTHKTGRLDHLVSGGQREMTAMDAVELTYAATSVFEPLKNVSIIDMLLNRPDADTILFKALKASQPLLALTTERMQNRVYSGTSRRFIFCNTKHPRFAEFEHFLQQKSFIKFDTTLEHFDNPHEITILCEEGALSLGAVHSLRDEGFAPWWNTYRKSRFSEAHSRGDIPEWVSWSQTEERDRERRKQMFLVASALNIIGSDDGKSSILRVKPGSASDRVIVKFSHDLYLAAALIQSHRLMSEIEARIYEQRISNSVTDFLEKIYAFAQMSGGKFVEGGRRLETNDLILWLLDYITNDTELHTAYTDRFS